MTINFSRKHCYCSLIFLSLAIFSAAGTTWATTFRHMTFVELVGEAHAVIRARSLFSESRWERGEIWTFTNFEVNVALKGNVPRLLTVRTLGGKAGHLRSIVEGVPQFHVGEEVYLFLGPGGTEPFPIFGWAQGTFRIHREKNSGQETVTQDSAGLAVFDTDTQKFRRGGIRNLPSEIFQKKISAVVDAR